jgi:hypothetical protein
MGIVEGIERFDKRSILRVTIPLGLILILYSYYLSYPLLMDAVDDFVYYHISPVYWLGLFILMPSLFVLATISERDVVRLLSCIGLLLSMYSIKFFYFSFPSSDVHYVRGLVEYALSTGDLDPGKAFHDYFQWPLFFVFIQMFSVLTNIDLTIIEYLSFIVFGVLYVSSLYVYYYNYDKKSNHISIMAFLLVMYWFLNYQFAPFSLAMAFLFILYMIESNDNLTINHTIISLLLYLCVVLTHPFAALFYIYYLLIMYAFSRRREHLQLFLFTLLIYMAYTIYSTEFFIPTVVGQIGRIDIMQYTVIVRRTFSGRVTERPFIDVLSQTFSRIIVISTGLFTGIGFLQLLYRRKLRNVDNLLLISSGIIAVAGALIPVIGMRVVFGLVIPISLGINYFFDSKYRRHTIALFLILVTLFPFIPLTQSFYDREVHFQTENEYVTSNFFIEHHNWLNRDSVLSHFRTSHYLKTRTSGRTLFPHDVQDAFPYNAEESDYIIYNVGIGKKFYSANFTLPTFLEENAYNRIYDSHFSYIASKSDDRVFLTP